MDAKTKHGLAYRYYRLIGAKMQRESHDSYPVGFDCPDRYRCDDRKCMCLEAAFKADEILKGIEVEIDRLKPLVTTDAIALAEQQFMTRYIKPNESRFIIRVPKYKLDDPNYELKHYENGIFWLTVRMEPVAAAAS